MNIKPRLTAALAVVLGTVLLSGCSTDNVYQRLGMPDPATKEGPRILSLWQGSWIAAMIVGVLVWGLLIWAIVVYRRKDESVPKQTKYNMPIEIGYTIVPLIMVMGLFYFTARDQTELIKIDNKNTHTVNVQAWRWSWGFNYVDEKVYDVGTPAVVPNLWLPVNEKVLFTLNSGDVIHSFWVPAFLMKMDVVPGRNNQFEVTPDRIGTFVGKCTELCGVDHSRMLFNVKVVSRADYDAHMKELKAKAQTGELKNPNARIAGAK
ncbi:MAG: cytochrome c oxidase subunit II [Actinobacteria bacterium]|nr:cytochrome c oxidase subunit II [Actinomycetota bacterium]